MLLQVVATERLSNGEEIYVRGRMPNHDSKEFPKYFKFPSTFSFLPFSHSRSYAFLQGLGFRVLSYLYVFMLIGGFMATFFDSSNG